MYGVGAGRYDIEEEIHDYAQWGSSQGHEGEEPADPDRYPPPQWCEAVIQAHDWATGEDGEPPADHHGCGAYYPCPVIGAAPAKPPGTACAASAPPAPIGSAMRAGQRSSRTTDHEAAPGWGPGLTQLAC